METIVAFWREKKENCRRMASKTLKTFPDDGKFGKSSKTKHLMGLERFHFSFAENQKSCRTRYNWRSSDLILNFSSSNSVFFLEIIITEWIIETRCEYITHEPTNREVLVYVEILRGDLNAIRWEWVSVALRHSWKQVGKQRKIQNGKRRRKFSQLWKTFEESKGF